MNKFYKSKFCTTPEQSKKLLKFLSPDSADMYYPNRVGIDNYPLPIEWKNGNPLLAQEIPCWSVQTLLDEIPDTLMNKVEEDLKLHIDRDDYSFGLFYENTYTGNMFEIETDYYDNMIDACVEMLVKLNKKKLL